ncbi:hyphal wall protein 2 [Aplysia californica]|uniref:Hyphal wall protein 2 n=1 Tax=Aplysia californica TaxID=6500 RepID=A0ABM1A248_APLCA|nr:hyphal wall protein 2 [Aplysia californica]XP_012939289.1 hyphal wall protein 2 [Aplysia californica]
MLMDRQLGVYAHLQPLRLTPVRSTSTCHDNIVTETSKTSVKTVTTVTTSRHADGKHVDRSRTTTTTRTRGKGLVVVNKPVCTSADTTDCEQRYLPEHHATLQDGIELERRVDEKENMETRNGLDVSGEGDSTLTAFGRRLNIKWTDKSDETSENEGLEALSSTVCNESSPVESGGFCVSGTIYHVPRVDHTSCEQAQTSASTHHHQQRVSSSSIIDDAQSLETEPLSSLQADPPDSVGGFRVTEIEYFVPRHTRVRNYSTSKKETNVESSNTLSQSLANTNHVSHSMSQGDDSRDTLPYSSLDLGPIWDISQLAAAGKKTRKKITCYRDYIDLI